MVNLRAGGLLLNDSILYKVHITQAPLAYVRIRPFFYLLFDTVDASDTISTARPCLIAAYVMEILKKAISPLDRYEVALLFYEGHNIKPTDNPVDL